MNKENKELKKRVEDFNKELVQLLGKYRLGLTAQPEIRLNGTITAKAIVVDVDSIKKQDETPEPPGEKVEGLTNPGE